MSSTRIRVLVADTAPTRLGVRVALDGVATICAEADNHEDAVALAARELPDLCLIGRGLSGNGIETVREICEAVPKTTVIVLAHDDFPHDILMAIRAGAIGYVPPAFAPAQLRRVVLAVRTDEPAIPRAMVRELLEEIRSGTGVGDGRLTGREMEVLSMLRRGASTAVIAETLAISPVTVRRHISALAHKAGVSSRGELLSAYGFPDARSPA